jgi:hypothetical protein
MVDLVRAVADERAGRPHGPELADHRKLMLHHHCDDARAQEIDEGVVQRDDGLRAVLHGAVESGRELGGITSGTDRNARPSTWFAASISFSCKRWLALCRSKSRPSG